MRGSKQLLYCHLLQSAILSGLYRVERYDRIRTKSWLHYKLCAACCIAIIRPLSAPKMPLSRADPCDLLPVLWALRLIDLHSLFMSLVAISHSACTSSTGHAFGTSPSSNPFCWKVIIALFMWFSGFFFLAGADGQQQRGWVQVPSLRHREGCHLLRHSHPLLHPTGSSWKPLSHVPNWKAHKTEVNPWIWWNSSKDISGRAAFIRIATLFHLLCAKWEWAALWWTGTWCKRSFWHMS